MTSGLAIIAGICLFFISKLGWQNANNALINIFIVTTSAGLLYQQLPVIFKQEINLGANRVLYIKYTELSYELLSYLATKHVKSLAPENPNQLTEVEPKIFIHSIDNKLAELNQIPIEFDATRVIKLNDVPNSLNIQTTDETPSTSTAKP